MADPIKTVKDYREFIQRLTIKSEVVDNAYVPIKIFPNSKRVATLRHSLHFKDGATLKFWEKIEIPADNKKIKRDSYSFHFETNDKTFHFRYERDKEASLDKSGNYRFDHPECHLHVNAKDPRFMTHATSFEEVFQFIVACFYQ